MKFNLHLMNIHRMSKIPIILITYIYKEEFTESIQYLLNNNVGEFSTNSSGVNP